jgi:biopolymer transport protein ExbD
VRVNLNDEEGAEIQMAPLIDCVFLLLIFFLVATTLKKIEKELRIELPDAAAAIEVAAQDDLLVIGVDRTGQLFLDAKPIATGDLHTRLRQIAQANPAQRIRIDADRHTPFQYVVQVFDLCQFEGLRNVGVHTRRGSAN